MADRNEKDEDESGKPKMNMVLVVLFSFLGLFCIAMIAAFAMLIKMQMSAPQDSSAAEVASSEPEKVLVKPSDEKGQESAKAEKVSDKPKKVLDEKAKPQFYKLRPTMVVNITSADKSRFLQVDVELMTRSASSLETIEAYAPLIRNDLITLFSTQRYEDIITLDGKELLRKKALETVQKIMKQNTGDPTVEQVLFTNFVSQ